MEEHNGIKCWSATDNLFHFTTDYSIFKLYNQNRDVDEQRKDKIRASFRSTGYVPVPIVVNEDYYVIDGQGRLAVAEELGVPLAYVIVPGIGMGACIDMNISSTPWGDWEYINSYAKSGNENYQRIVNLSRDFEWANLSNILMATTGLMRSNDKVRNGNLRVTEDHRDYAIELLSFIESIRSELDSNRLRDDLVKIANIVMFAYQVDGVDVTRLMYTIEKYVEHIAKYRKTEDQLKELSKRYNKGASRKSRIHFEISYADARIDNDSWYAVKWGWADPSKATVKGTGKRYDAQQKFDWYYD